MDRRVLFGHHFAAIAGAGPLVGPVLAAQMGFLPGTIWIIVGVILAGAVQDMTTLFFSMRRDGKSLGQMAREEIGPIGGVAADRKSVVEGKRVDLGGRRIIKKKNRLVLCRP